MLRRRVVGRAVVRTAAVGGVAYAAGHHVATKSAQQTQMDAQQNAQIDDLQQQQAAGQAAPAQPVYQQPPPPMYQQPAPQAAAPAPSSWVTTEKDDERKQPGQITEFGLQT